MYALFGFAMYKVFEEGNDKRALIVYNWLVAVSLGVYNILFCVTHWIFAAKNWVIASQQEKVSKRLNNSERINYNYSDPNNNNELPSKRVLDFTQLIW